MINKLRVTLLMGKAASPPGHSYLPEFPYMVTIHTEITFYTATILCYKTHCIVLP